MMIENKIDDKDNIFESDNDNIVGISGRHPLLYEPLFPNPYFGIPVSALLAAISP